MRNKLILELYDDNEELTDTIPCKSFKEIAIKTGMDYHNCRTIYSYCTGEKTPKYTHRTLKKLLKKVKILDNSDILI